MGRSFSIGLLPAAGGGLKALAATGQINRLIDYYFPAYLNAFQQVFYFSYDREQLDAYVDDIAPLKAITVIPKESTVPYRVYAFQLPFVAKTQLQACNVLRVFQTTGAIPGMMARVLYGIPYVTTYGYKYHALAGVEGQQLSRVYLRLLEPLALRLAAGIIVTTQELVDYVSRFVAPSKIHLIPNGVDTTLFIPAQNTTHGRSQKTVLFVGRLTRQKNLFRLLEALRIVARDHSIRLQIIGTGALQAELGREADQLDLNCSFEGTVPYSTLPTYMQQADIFALPSLIEGHPKVLIEAMSCGLPCVASSCQGNRMVLAHEKTGLLFEPTDVTQMAQQISRVLANPELSYSLGQAARKFVCANFDIHQLLNQETALLQAIGETNEPKTS